jgi:hypothetical protein
VNKQRKHAHARSQAPRAPWRCSPRRSAGGRCRSARARAARARRAAAAAAQRRRTRAPRSAAPARQGRRSLPRARSLPAAAAREARSAAQQGTQAQSALGLRIHSVRTCPAVAAEVVLAAAGGHLRAGQRLEADAARALRARVKGQTGASRVRVERENSAQECCGARGARCRTRTSPAVLRASGAAAGDRPAALRTAASSCGAQEQKGLVSGSVCQRAVQQTRWRKRASRAWKYSSCTRAALHL